MSDSLTPRVWMGQDNVGILRSCFGLAKSCRNWTWKKSDVKTSPTSRYFGHFCDTKVRWRISLQTTRRRLQHCHGFAKLKRCQDCYRSLRLKVKGFKLVFQMSAKFPTRLLHLFNKPLYLCGKIPSTIWGSSSGGERFTRVWHPSFIELSTKYEKKHVDIRNILHICIVFTDNNTVDGQDPAPPRMMINYNDYPII